MNECLDGVVLQGRRKSERAELSALTSEQPRPRVGLRWQLVCATRRRDDPEPRASYCPSPHSQQRREGSVALLALLCGFFFDFSIVFGSVLSAELTDRLL